MLCLRDPLNFAEPAFLSYEALDIIRYFDGSHAILDIQVAYTRKHGGILVSDDVRKLIAQLDEKLFMDSEHFRQHRKEVESAFLNAPLRAATHAGIAYPDATHRQAGN